MQSDGAAKTEAMPGLGDRIQRMATAAAYALRPKRIGDMPGLMRAMAAHYAMPPVLRPAIPDPHRALARPEGFAGICPNLDVDTMMAGYRAGLFQVSHVGPYKWWSPERRMALFLDRLHLEKNLKRKLRQGKYTIAFNKRFREVVEHCAGPREQRRIQLTWLVPEVIGCFEQLNALGHAHSVEVLDEAGTLVGGLFGVAFGKIFVTESQFALERDVSKVAFAVLNRHLQAWGYLLNDVHFWSSHLERLGCELVDRGQFLAIVRRYGQGDNWEAGWSPVEALCSGEWNPADSGGWTKASVLALIDGEHAGSAAHEWAVEPVTAGDNRQEPRRVA